MLEGKVALITGACGDIGRAIAELLARNGARIVANDLCELEAAQPLLQCIADLDGKAIYCKADVTDHAAVKELVKNAVDQFGRLDICIANAGVVVFKPLMEITDEDWDHQLSVNLDGCFYVAQESARVMIEQNSGGKIVFTSSWVQDIPAKKLTAYCVSKSGLKMLAKCMALELGVYDINVNLVAPGNVDAGLSGRVYKENPQAKEQSCRLAPLGRVMSAAEVAEAALFLCSKGSDYMTGSTILIDGGASLFARD
jgi:NAD(P)-dependent dehydrogenase (short-subunit alcohol dehydrogenase family)